jgi:hypothetical protein
MFEGKIILQNGRVQPTSVRHEVEEIETEAEGVGEAAHERDLLKGRLQKQFGYVRCRIRFWNIR